MPQVIRTFQNKDNLTENSFDIFLGHRRLSIIDLSEDGNRAHGK